MPRIPFTIRRDGRYYFRRRARWQNGNEVNVVVPLATCSAQAARNRSAGLAAHFDKVKNAVGAYFDRDRSLEPATLKRLFENELRACLSRLVESFYDPAANPAALVALYRTHASAYDIAQRVGTGNELTEGQRAELAAAGHDEMDIEFVACDLDRYCGKDSVNEETLQIIAEDLGIAPTPAVIGRMRSIQLQANAEAHRLAAHFLDPAVQAAFDPEGALLARRRANGEPLTFAALSAAAPAHAARHSGAVTSLAADTEPAIISAASASGSSSRAKDARPCPFAQYHETRFSAAIPRILELARLGGHWTRNLGQYERVLRTFAWITGDKPLGDYDHADVGHFKNGLLRLPRDFKPAKDFDRPFAEVLAELGNTGKPRSLNTVKRDLSYMSTASDILAEDEWQPAVPGMKVLDFSKAKLAKHKKVSAKTARPVWTAAHMRCLFSAPLWTGGGAHLHRLDGHAGDTVYQDAAYWLPIILYYTHATAGEIAGLRADEVNPDDVVPNLVIKDNDVRAETDASGTVISEGGEKNEHRGRVVPLHPEIMRLGFGDYVRAIRDEGHRELFPELYTNRARTGAHQFRNIAWGHMVAWIRLHMEIPRNEASGKEADMHSIRALGSSMYAKANIPDLIRADIMGHARSGTNALHYSKRAETHGLDQVLYEYREIMIAHVDVVTGELTPKRIELLPLRVRSKTGKPHPGRVTR